MYFGFGPNPELVLRANADDRQRAVFADMTSPATALPIRERGNAAVRHVADGSPDGTEMLTVGLRRAIAIDPSCTRTSFNGTFLGVLTILPESPE